LVTPPPAVPQHGLARFDQHDAAHRYALLAVSADEGRIVATPDPDARTAEGYLRMTARILLEAPSKKPWRSIGVISAQEGEGRSAAAVNLAVCLGRAKGRRGRVLLVDGDARYRTLSRMFCGTDASSAPEGEGPRHPMLIGPALDGVGLMTAPILDDGSSLSAPGAWIETFEELGPSTLTTRTTARPCSTTPRASCCASACRTWSSWCAPATRRGAWSRRPSATSGIGSSA
jgi:hypothetical protein